MRLPVFPRKVVSVKAGYFHALALLADDWPVLNGTLATPLRTGNSFSFSIPTVRGWRYFLEYSDSLGDTGWKTLVPVPGDGQVKVLADPVVTTPHRFYRVRQQN